MVRGRGDVQEAPDAHGQLADQVFMLVWCPEETLFLLHHVATLLYMGSCLYLQAGDLSVALLALSLPCARRDLTLVAAAASSWERSPTPSTTSMPSRTAWHAAPTYSPTLLTNLPQLISSIDSRSPGVFSLRELLRAASASFSCGGGEQAVCWVLFKAYMLESRGSAIPLIFRIVISPGPAGAAAPPGVYSQWQLSQCGPGLRRRRRVRRRHRGTVTVTSPSYTGTTQWPMIAASQNPGPPPVIEPPYYTVVRPGPIQPQLKLPGR
eukprot:753932-Hanusia_phi.AAC.5